MAKFLVLHGPNLNLLGTREPEHYGAETLVEINDRLVQLATAQGHKLHHFQTNAEHELIERIHAAKADQIDFIIINPAAFTHTSIALRDALAAINPLIPAPTTRISLSTFSGCIQMSRSKGKSRRIFPG